MTHYTAPPDHRDPPDNGLNIASLVLGIISVTIPFVGIITGPLAVIFAVHVRRHKEINGMGTAGFITGAVASLAYFLVFLLVAVVPFIAAIGSVPQ